MPVPPPDSPPAVSLPPKRGGAWKLLVLLAIIVGGFVTFRFTPLRQYADLNLLKTKLEVLRVHWWAGPLYSLLYAAGCLVGNSQELVSDRTRDRHTLGTGDNFGLGR